MNRATRNKVVRSVSRMYFYACASLLVGFLLPFFFEPLRAVGSSMLSVIMFELSPVLSTLVFGFVVATLSLFTWNFLLGSVVAQIISGVFGAEAPRIILVGKSAVIGFIYGATYESILHALDYDPTNFVILVVVVLTEFLAYSIATYGGIRVGKSIGKLDDGTTFQRIVNNLIGPLPYTYKKVKNDLKREMTAAFRLCPIIATILLFSAALEIWLVLG